MSWQRAWPTGGFTAAKFGWGPMGQSEANDIALVREARRGLGESVDLMIDAGQPWDWRTALVRSRQFAEFRPFLAGGAAPPRRRCGLRQAHRRERDSRLPGASRSPG